MSHLRLYAQKDRLEDEIRRLEASLRSKCNELSLISKMDIDQDLEMVKRMREILLVLREEHQEIMNGINRALETVSRTCDRPSAEPMFSRPLSLDCPQHMPSPILSSNSDLDMLVRRVQEAIGDEPPRSPELKRYFSSYNSPNNYTMQDSPNDSCCSGSSELSVASKQYLQKYNLMPTSPTLHRHHRHQYRDHYKPVRPSRLTFEPNHGDYSPPLYPKYKHTKHEDAENSGNNNRILPNIL